MTHYFDEAWANAGDKTSIPITIQPSGDVSYPEGYTPDYELDQEVNPSAKDLSRQTDNQLRFDITELLKEIQEKGFLPYRADVNYLVPSFSVGSDSKVYIATAVNGPDTTAVDPVGDLTGVWILFISDYVDVKSGRKNTLDNGNFDPWQRGTSTTADNVFLADRWKVIHNGTATVSQHVFSLGQTDVPNEPEFGLRVNKTVIGAGDINVFSRVRGVRTLAGQQITISFYANTTVDATWTVRAIQNFGSGGGESGQVITSDTVNVTSSIVRHTVTLTLPSISGKTIGANGGDFLQIGIQTGADRVENILVAQWQVEKGSVATDFEYHSFEETLSRCQPYFEKSYDTEVDPGTITNAGVHEFEAQVTSSVLNFTQSVGFRVTKIAPATLTIFNPATGVSRQWRNVTAASDIATLSGSQGEGNFNISKTSGETVTAGDQIIFHWTSEAEL